MSDCLAILRSLREVTEAQLDAAIRIDPTRLTALNEERGALLFSLEVALAEPIDADERPHVAAEARALADVETRVAQVARSVLHTLDRLSPGRPPARYSRTGVVR